MTHDTQVPTGSDTPPDLDTTVENYWRGRCLTAEDEAANLRHALATRPDIDRVVGMFMVLLSCSADAAWAALSRTSQQTNRKVVDISRLVAAFVAGHGPPLPGDVVRALGDVLPPSTARRP